MNRKKIFSHKKIIIYIFCLILLLISVSAFAVENYVKRFNKVNPTKNNMILQQTDVEKPNLNKSNQNYIKNIALLGIDSSDDDTGGSDCILIATIDTEHNKIKLSSIIRDSYVTIPGRSGKDKINHAYAFGGPELAMETLNKNFDLNISQFASVNLASFPKIIDSIGGIELDIKDDELAYINEYIQSLNDANGTSSPDITSSGLQSVDGTQALAYARIRYTDGGDFERSHRQRTVMEKVFEKLKSIPVIKYPEALDLLLPIINTNLSSSEILSLCLDLMTVDHNNIIEERFPKDEDAEGKAIDGIYYYVFDEEATIDKIHNFIYEP